jgi:excisionase family DNA binding protein
MGPSELSANWYTVQEIATQLKVSRSNVYQLVERGVLVAHRIGAGRGCIRIAQEDFEAYLESVRLLPALSASRRSTRSSARPRIPGLFKHLEVNRRPSSRS